MQRHVRQLGGKKAVRGDGGLHVVRLRRDDHVVEVAFVLEEADEPTADAHSFSGRDRSSLPASASSREPAFTPMRMGDPASRAASTTGRVFSKPRCCGVDAQLRRASASRLDGDLRVEVDVGDHGQRRLGAHRGERVEAVLRGIAMRTTSHPASASAAICARFAETSSAGR